MSLTPKKARFVQEYLVDLNATQAATRTGFSAKTAYSQGQRLLKDVEVAKAIETAMEKRSQRTEITQDRVLRELAKIGFTDISAVVSWGSKEVAFGYDDDGKQLPASQIGDAVMVHREVAPFVEAINSEDLPDEVRAAVSEVALTKDGLKIKMHDKRAALETIGRHLGMFKDKIEHSGPDGAALQPTVVTVYALPDNGRSSGG